MVALSFLLWFRTTLFNCIFFFDFGSIKKHDTYDAPIKSKEELVFHVGFRQFVARYASMLMLVLLNFFLYLSPFPDRLIAVVCRPIFSSDNMNSDKHKMEKFLHAGRFSVASIYAPISFPHVPLIALKSVNDAAVSPAIVAFGSLRSIDPDRIILKKIILTGYGIRLICNWHYDFHMD